MGLWEWLFGSGGTSGEIARPLAPPYPDLSAAIRAYAAARAGAPFDPLELPAVERGVELLASAVAQLTPVAYREGLPDPAQPRIVERPDPWSTRYDHLFATVRSMVEHGAAHWFLFDHEEGRARAARVVDPAEVELELDEARFLPVVRWRGRKMTPGVDWKTIRLAPRAGYPGGVSPLAAGREALLHIAAAEAFAGGYFASGGVPSGVLTSPVELTDDEADRLKARWLEAHSGTPTPAVLSGGIGYEKTASDPESSQLVETREQGVATVARLLGIPAPLLLVSIAGSSITYANVSQLYSELIRSTVAPLYLAPIEAAWSELVPRTSAVRFDLGELARLDVRSRFEVYQLGAALGIYDAGAIARLEGLPAEPASSPTLYSPTPNPAGVAVPEVPA